LEPGSFLEINKDNELKISRYFSFSVYPNEFINKKRLIAYEEKVLSLLKESIKKRLNSDVPLGTFLSGGVDSSITSAIITKDFNINLNTFSIGFENYQDSEHQTASEISKQIDSHHNEIILTNSDTSKVFEKMGQLMDELNGDRGFIPMYVVSRYAKEFVTVTLSGDGSDELFGGYPRHWMLQNRYSSKFTTYNADKIFELYLEDLLPVFKMSTLKELDVKKYESLVDKFKRHYLNPYRSIASSTRELDFNSYMRCVLSKVDTASMQSSLEVRTPFLSLELIKSAQGFPNELLFNGQDTKVVLRKILGRYISNNIAMLPKKGFGLPLHSLNFLNQNYKKIFSESFEILRNSNFFSIRPHYLNFLKKNFNQNSNSQWNVLVLARWIDSINTNL